MTVDNRLLTHIPKVVPDNIQATYDALAKQPIRLQPTAIDLPEDVIENDPGKVCDKCLYSPCCVIESAIMLSQHDIDRLAHHLELSVEQFRTLFTQTHIPDLGPAKEDEHLTDPQDPTITYLRRISNYSSAPCIFLKYVKDEEGRIINRCSVHLARPEPCREFQFDGCRGRITGELASVGASATIAMANGEITQEMIREQLEHYQGFDYNSESLQANLHFTFWMSLYRRANYSESNVMPVTSYDITKFQATEYVATGKPYSHEPEITARSDAKLEELPRIAETERYRLLYRVSVKANDVENQILSIGDLSADIDIGYKEIFYGRTSDQPFAKFSNTEIYAVLNSLPRTKPFPKHDISLTDIYYSIFKGLNYFIGFVNESYRSNRFEYCEHYFDDAEEQDKLNILVEWISMLDTFRATSLNDLFRHPKLLGLQHSLYEMYLPVLSNYMLENPDEELYGNVLGSRTFKYFDNNVLCQQVLDHFQALSSNKKGKFWSSFDLQEDDWDAIYDDVMVLREHLYLPTNNLAETYWLDATNRLIEFPIDRNNFVDLINILAHIGFSASDYGRQILPVKLQQRMLPAANKITNFILTNSLFDPEGLPEFCDSIFRPSGIPYSNTAFGDIIAAILSSQEPEGSWLTNYVKLDSLPGNQTGYFYQIYHSIWVCVDALRPNCYDIQFNPNIVLA